MDYAGTSLQIELRNAGSHVPFIREFIHKHGAVDNRLALIAAARSFATSEMFKSVTRHLNVSFDLTVSVDVNLSMPQNAVYIDFHEIVENGTGFVITVMGNLYTVYKCEPGQTTKGLLANLKPGRIFLFAEIDAGGKSKWLIDELRNTANVTFETTEDIVNMCAVMKYCCEIAKRGKDNLKGV